MVAVTVRLRFKLDPTRTLFRFRVTQDKTTSESSTFTV